MTEGVKTSKLAAMRKGFVRFFKDVRSELKKVIWPNREQLTNNTLTVLACCLLVGVLIWIADYLLGKGTALIFTR